MSRLAVFSGVIAALVIALLAPAPTTAFTYDKLTFMTFNAPVQIPGVTLGAGTYQFRLADPNGDRSVLQVLNHDGTSVYAMFFTRTSYRDKVTADTVVTFMEVPKGVPPAANAIFYSGERRGYSFVYPKGRPILDPKVWLPAEVAATPEPAVAAPIAAPEPEIVAEALPEAAPAPVAEPVFEPVEEQAPAAPAPAELPRTATPLPFVALGGLMSLLAGIGLLRRRDG